MAGERERVRSGRVVVVRAGAALAAAVGVGRFVYTPILPLMEAQAGLAKGSASLLATSNYLGYLIGALLGIAVPLLGRARVALRVSGVVLVGSLAVMPLTHDVTAWIAVRGVAGVASAVIFMVAGNAILTELTSAKPHVVGWAYGGVGAGIAASGILITIVGAIGDWATSWWSSAGLTALLLAVGWFVGETGRRRPAEAKATAGQRRRTFWFPLLTASYFLEGAGYIIAGTFLVAAVGAAGPGWIGGSVWTIVGLAAVPSCAAWTWLSGRISRPSLITAALLLQAAGIALPAVSDGTIAAVAGAVLFGGTFVGITTLSLATGRHLGVPSAIAILTAGYGIGQVVGPLVVTPVLAGGYRPVLLVGAAIVLAGAVCSVLVRIRFPATPR